MIFKSGAEPSNEMSYIQQVCESIGLSMTDLEGAHIDVRCADSSSLNQQYVMGYALHSGFNTDRCTLTPFTDRDGGQGLVLKGQRQTGLTLNAGTSSLGYRLI